MGRWDDKRLVRFRIFPSSFRPPLWHSWCCFSHGMRYLIPICLTAALAWGVVSWMIGPSIRTPAGVLVAEEPLQENCPAHVVAQMKDYTVTAVAAYTIRGRVLHTKHYWADGNDLVPYDVALGWGRMSDQSVLDHLEISQGNRFYFYQWHGESPIPQDEIVAHSSNNHLIAASNAIAHVISGLYPGEIVTMQGYLVNVSKPNGFHWNTSLSRTDTGNGACEVFYVEGIKAERPAGS